MNQDLALKIGLTVLALYKAEFEKQADGADFSKSGAKPAESTPPESTLPESTLPESGQPKSGQPKSGRRGRPVGSVNTKPYSGRSPGRPRVRPAEETLERNKAYKRAWALKNADRIRANRQRAASDAKRVAVTA